MALPDIDEFLSGAKLVASIDHLRIPISLPRHEKRRPEPGPPFLISIASGSAGGSDALIGHQLLQFARFIHFHHDVATAYELALHI